MITVYTALRVVLIPVVGVISDQYGRKPVRLAGLLTFGIAGSAISLTTDFRVVLGFRFLQGIAFAGLLPVIITVIGVVYKGGRETTAHGIHFASTGFTHTVFPAIAGFVVAITWQSPFLLYVVAIPIARLVYVNLQETRTERETTDSDYAGHVPYIRALTGTVLERRILAVLVAYSLPQFLLVVFWTLNSFLIVDILDGTAQQAGLLVATFSVIYAVATSQTRKLSSTFGDRIHMLIGANGCLVIGVAVVAFSA